SEVKIGQTFKVNVSITEVLGLQGFDFCLSYNTTILDCLEVAEGPFMASFGPTLIVKLEIDDGYNKSQGCIWMAVVIYGNASATGRGTLATITFNATAPGEGSLDLHSILPYNPDAVKLSTCDPKAISNKAVDGYFKVSSDLSTCFISSDLISSDSRHCNSGKGLPLLSGASEMEPKRRPERRQLS
ncbi:MAG: cohesin domain-containing protein, partial [Candidatus Bathyarchaeota archaeon]|nr:cohesin domain-containing protein [Candidatus Bathyarchaeota archaeon]